MNNQHKVNKLWYILTMKYSEDTDNGSVGDLTFGIAG